MADQGGFYEEDEATEDIVAAFEQSERGVTARPAFPLFQFVGESLNEGSYTLISAPTVGGQLARWSDGYAANVASPPADRISATA
jgi:hypothetical protein